MNNPSFEFFKSKFNISKGTFLTLQKLSEYKLLKRGERIADQGGTSTTVFFLTSGLMRSKRQNELGKEYTKNIYSPLSFVAPFSSILTNQPSLLSYEALTDCKGFEIDFETFYELTKTNIKISNLYNRILEYLFIIYERKQMETMSLNATERYGLLKRRIRNIDKKIPQYQIASYLNITPVQLSRIRKEIQEN